MAIVEDMDDYAEFAEVEWVGATYEFDLTRVYLQKSTGMLFYAEDSGCSCPRPFEGTEESDLTPINRPQDWNNHVVKRTVYPGPDVHDYEVTPTSAIDQAERVRRTIMAHLTK